jgi:hypothetical protein
MGFGKSFEENPVVVKGDVIKLARKNKKSMP